ncbi:glucuronyl hydrolase [Pedobacter yulinensis]|uniref:Glucuronyl hydrolase n=1 Tax=Pedobacter yulinensis TaxID=2126353 RepID=A0A2T3HR99_9SPHI|nr:glycoside hydrolase family 88 protein [Pedobacter yulinensis]PST84984.1 glucuronyl hydrolase [Pedobacter yulinensis]
MKRAIICIMLLASLTAGAQRDAIKKQFTAFEPQVGLLLREAARVAQNGRNFPRTTEKGKLKNVISRDWTSGFFPGMLWLMYEGTANKKWLEAAREYTEKMKTEQFNKGTHDLGFMMYCSFGNGLRLTADTAYRKVLIQSAQSLISRFNEKTGVIRSWDHHQDVWKFPVIIDNMMNLELLFEATRLTGDSTFHKIAVRHADVTLKNHFRPDHSSFHVVDYDPETGHVRKKMTHQGYADASAWARGQAWGLYGYAVCYRYTRDKKYLVQAEHIAGYIIRHPRATADLIPYWDYDAPGAGQPRDASAAAITSSALFELSTLSGKPEYRQKAQLIVDNLGRGYRSAPGQNAGFILEHSTGHLPAGSEIDVPLVYADYYYLEALLRSKK